MIYFVKAVDFDQNCQIFIKSTQFLIQYTIFTMISDHGIQPNPDIVLYIQEYRLITIFR